MFRSTLTRCLAALTLACTATSAAHAEEWALLGARYQAMGGAGVAVADDSQAAYWNPGALAFTTSYDVSMPIGVTAGVEGDVINRVDQIVDFVDQSGGVIDDIINTLEAGGDLTEAQRDTALALVLTELPQLNQKGEGILGTVQAGVGMRWERVAITGFGLGYFAGDPELDTVNLGLANAAGLNGLVGTTPAPDFSGQPALQALADSIVTADPTIAQGDAEKFVSLANGAAPGLANNPAVQNLVRNIALASQGSSNTTFDNNSSGADARGLITAQVGVAYGHPVPELPFLPWIKDRVGVGAHLKYIRGIAFNTNIRFDNADDLAGDILNLENTQSSNDWGLDLGVKVKVFDWLHAGMVARNVNSPSFDFLDNQGQKAGSFTLDPQVRMGFAFFPLPNWIISADVDLTTNTSELLRGYESQVLAAGTEYKIPVWLLGLAFRGGIFTNVGSGANSAPVFTGGLGLRVWHFNLDLAGAVSSKFEDVADSGSFPGKASGSVMLSFHKKF